MIFNILALLLVGYICLLSPPASATSVSWNQRSFSIDGKPTMLIGGSFHYPRASPSEWPSIFSEMKANGLNLVQTYVFWDLHEPVEGEYFFPDDPQDPANLVLFLQEAQKAGLYVHLRIGPYACAEWNNGGIPVWMTTEHDDVVFRTDDSFWLTKIENFLDATLQVVSDANLMASQNGPIIMAQIENEYGNVEYAYGPSGARYVAKVADYAVNHPIGSEVPWVMCQQGVIASKGTSPPSNVISACNGYYCDNWIEDHISAFPEQPHMFTENWPGWFQKWGEAVPHRPATDVAFSVARWFAKGGSFMNYYMAFGGTSLARQVGGPNIITSYDYDVQINEYGFRAEPKFSLTAALHQALYEVQNTMFDAAPTPATFNGTESCETHTYFAADSDKCSVWLSNWGEKNECVFEDEGWVIPAWSVSVASGKAIEGANGLSSCGGLEFLYSTKGLDDSEPANELVAANLDTKIENLNLVSSVKIPTVDDSGDNIYTFDSPQEQLSLTKDKTDYLWYTATYDAPAANDNAILELEAGLAGGVSLMVYINGELKTTERSVSDAQGQLEDVDWATHEALKIPVVEGVNSIAILSMSTGLRNYGPYIERARVGILSDIRVDGKVLSNVVHTVGMAGEGSGGEVGESWEGREDGSLTFYKGEFAVTAEGPLALDMTTMGKGFVAVNGHHIGRFWSVKANDKCNACDEFGYVGSYNADNCRTGCDDFSQHYYKIPDSFLSTDSPNELVVFTETGGDPAGIKLVSMSMADKL
ncbi:hypothetical protein TrLO_g5338 [Triparma laevis f. longispina]|uniref:beta-galactosidase n=1 Tax=Triparma laevis f. longispina TaxID=1714387 RepID=A0A9W7KY68_9STRA|nr:hypothetical protein TrLO_g5338 [Triparma laevis f. longispina]